MRRHKIKCTRTYQGTKPFNNTFVNPKLICITEDNFLYCLHRIVDILGLITRKETHKKTKTFSTSKKPKENYQISDLL